MTPAFRKTLADWYARSARSLPWRTRVSPYRVLVSEIMLQQTRVEVVRDYFTRFVRRFPSFKALAAADTDDVLAAWSGLGYYRRARMLHACAREVVARHNGRLPDSADALRALPGIGPYTAGAILSLAFNQPAAIADGNVERVFARLTALEHNVKQASGRRAVWQLATEHVTRGAAEGLPPPVLNQSLMELGAVVCKPVPDCAACPVRRWCRAAKAGNAVAYPVLPARRASIKTRYLLAMVQDASGRVLLTRREGGDSLLPAGLWELPHTTCDDEAAALARIEAALGCKLAAQGKPLRRRHSIMHYRLELLALPCSGDARETPDARWFTPRDAAAAAMASATRKLLDAAQRKMRNRLE